LLFFRAAAEGFFWLAFSLAKVFRLEVAFGKVQRFENQMA
jgi:hypothetical protein